MRSLLLTLTLVPLLLASSGCKSRSGNSAPTLSPASSIFAGDPAVAGHFAKGFYDAEQNAWRWTGREFAVDLTPPLHSNEKGAQLVMKFAVPDAVIQQLNAVQLSAAIQNYKFDPQVYSKSGDYTYTRDVPADALKSDVVRINFALDHALPPTDSDRRQLGVIVSQVGLVAK